MLTSRASALRAARRVTALSVAPVMAEMISSCEVVLTSKTPLLRPRRSTATLSATALTSAMLWLMRITARPRSRSRSTRSRTWAVCSTPRAAVGSSRMTSLGSPSSERAMATVCRWPPESEAIGIRTLGMRMDSVSSSSRARRSISTSSRTPQRADLPAEEEVADDVEVVAQREVLVDGRDAQVLGVVRAVDLDRLALPLDDALIDGVRRRRSS